MQWGICPQWHKNCKTNISFCFFPIMFLCYYMGVMEHLLRDLRYNYTGRAKSRVWKNMISAVLFQTFCQRSPRQGRVGTNSSSQGMDVAGKPPLACQHLSLKRGTGMPFLDWEEAAHTFTELTNWCHSRWRLLGPVLNVGNGEKKTMSSYSLMINKCAHCLWNCDFTILVLWHQRWSSGGLCCFWLPNSLLHADG